MRYKRGTILKETNTAPVEERGHMVIKDLESRIREPEPGTGGGDVHYDTNYIYDYFLNGSCDRRATTRSADMVEGWVGNGILSRIDKEEAPPIVQRHAENAKR